ncbi:RxLR effector protein Htp1 [Phytophthora ramorum]|uniref:RxLR effector protein Htp1 n=1 Tax=Phytophthora ramorum TaxID=164328 RepID=UPI003097DDB8|nr:RxLR effector protein Htp1 [Phytophthora ramorum]
MVYSSSRTGTRSLIKTAVLCALSLSVIPSTYATGSLDASSSGDVCGLSDGDKSVGIRVIDDSSCASGGLGCYNDHCRYCKLLETPQSTSFENCTTFGVDFPTMAPLVASVGTCEVSSGDAAVGISAIADPTCLYGGLGCFNDHCRFCKLESTAQSEAFVDCTASNSTDGTSTEAPVNPTTSAPSTTVDTDGCSLVPADGDIEVGISIGTDPTCSAGGLGCINDVCRFCRVTTTTKSASYLDCALLGTSAVSSGTAGVAEVPAETPTATTETPTETPTVTVAAETPTGTTATETPAPDVTTETPAATTEAPAATDAATPGVTTEAPAATDAATPGVTTEAPAATTAAPTSTTAAPAADATCTIAASVGDAAVGISIVTDATCASGGIGCINDVCRFCKVTTSTQSAAFTDCALFASDVPTSEVPTADNVDGSDVLDFSTDDSDFSDASDAETPVTTTDMPTETPSATTAVPDVTTEAPTATVETPAATTAVPDATTEAPTATTAAVVPDATTEAPAQPTCPQKASEGDAAVGINIITDTSCSSGGVGCIDDVCRFCKVTTTTQSAAFVDCATVPTTTEAPTEAPTETPTEAPTETPTEAPTETPTEAPTETPTEAPTETPTEAPSGATCTQKVSEGDAAVGIDIVTDASCSAGGVGCIDNVCRFCKATETQQSSAFEDCSTITGVAAEALTGNAEAFSAKQTRADAPEPDNVPILSQYQAGAFVGGCVVAIAAVALVARAAKKANNSNANPNDGDNADDAESGQHVSPGPVPTEDDDEVTTISTEA